MVHNQLQAKDDCWRIDALSKLQPIKVHSKKMQYMKVHHGEVHHKEVHHEEVQLKLQHIYRSTPRRRLDASTPARNASTLAGTSLTPDLNNRVLRTASLLVGGSLGDVMLMVIH